MKTAHAKTMTKRYQLRTYDVLGNSKDGFEVNDTCLTSTIIEIVCKVEVFNGGTEREFVTYEPTDIQLARALGCKGMEFEWSEGSYYINRKSNGRPEGEIELLAD